MLLALLAQVTPPAPIDWMQVGSGLVVALTPTAVFLVLWIFKTVFSKIPASVVVFSTPILGYLANYVLAYVTGLVPSSPVMAAVLGLVAIALREIITTLGSKGLNGPITPTKAML